MNTSALIESLIRTVPDFPKPGVLFRDITPLLADARGFGAAVEALVEPWRAQPPQVFCGVESRGFIFAAAMAQSLGCGFAPMRKSGRLPGPVLRERYSLEYGEDTLELRADALPPAAGVVIVDDVLATGGTLRAASNLVARSGAQLLGAGVLIELESLGGRERLPALAQLHAVLRY